jgi:hypothetical protein
MTGEMHRRVPMSTRNVFDSLHVYFGDDGVDEINVSNTVLVEILIADYKRQALSGPADVAVCFVEKQGRGLPYVHGRGLPLFHRYGCRVSLDIAANVKTCNYLYKYVLKSP